MFLSFYLRFSTYLCLLLLVRLHDQSSSSDEVGGLLQVLQAHQLISSEAELLVTTVRFAMVGVCQKGGMHLSPVWVSVLF